ncbi:MAG: SDR family oxidoreductase [Planctomycetaceae bacterium]|nr:SDR family oxidoreductase [Planctomycetaceae bacterium]
MDAQSPTGRVAIVTGASAGIGKAISRRLASRGFRVVLAARTPSALDSLAEELTTAGCTVSACIADVSSLESLEHLTEFTIRTFGRIDVLVNNAGGDCFAETDQISPERIQQTIQTNLTGAIWLVRLVLPQMKKQGSGSIVNMASTAGKHGPAYGGVYAATKAGLIGLTQGLRGELHGSRIRVSAVCPGFTKDGGIYDRIVQLTGKRISPLVGGTTAEAVAAAVEKAIRSGGPEYIVNWPPLRPMMILRECLPTFAETLILAASRRFLRRAATAESVER